MTAAASGPHLKVSLSSTDRLACSPANVSATSRVAISVQRNIGILSAPASWVAGLSWPRVMDVARRSTGSDSFIETHPHTTLARVMAAATKSGAS